jgi:hypothetical protein
MVTALAILTIAILPLSYMFGSELSLCRRYYNRAVAMEIVDGEMEVLVAGEWRAYANGTHPYPIHADAAKNLPAGNFVLTVHDKHLRLEWSPADHRQAANIFREATAR